jgi:DNA-binding TFAR19-related protein (PDSD5 family)
MKKELLQTINYAKSEALIQLYQFNKFGEQIYDDDLAEILKYK